MARSLRDLKSSMEGQIDEYWDILRDEDHEDYDVYLDEAIDNAIPVYNSELVEMLGDNLALGFQHDESYANPEAGIFGMIQSAIHRELCGHAETYIRDKREEDEGNEAN